MIWSEFGSLLIGAESRRVDYALFLPCLSLFNLMGKVLACVIVQDKKSFKLQFSSFHWDVAGYTFLVFCVEALFGCFSPSYPWQRFCNHITQTYSMSQKFDCSPLVFVRFSAPISSLVSSPFHWLIDRWCKTHYFYKISLALQIIKDTFKTFCRSNSNDDVFII